MIREAEEKDFNDIDDQSRKFWAHTQFDDEYVSSLFYIRLAYDCGLLLVCEVDGEVVGFAAGVTSPLLGNQEVLTGTELAWWVEPNYRSGRHGILLLKALEDKAKAIGCKYWTMIAMETSMPNKITGMYERLGYNKAETSYTKRMD